MLVAVLPSVLHGRGSWLVPHFEKMLYDNAQLTVAYLEAYQLTGDSRHADVARDVLRYVQREMTRPEGAFWSATDADSLSPDGEREEGRFFTWTPAELRDVLGPDAELVEAWYGVSEGGNFEGRNILHTPRATADVASEVGVDPAELAATVERARSALYRARAERPPPLLDDKVLTSWNGLMISAFARAAWVLDEPEYAAIGARAADFLLTELRDDQGRLARSWRDGRARHTAVLDDYAFVIAALIDLFEATGDGRWLAEAQALERIVQTHYADPAGGWFLTPDDGEVLLAREKPDADGAEPSGNSVHVRNLLRLNALTGDDRYRERADRALRSFGAILEQRPGAASELLLALHWRHGSAKEVVLVTPTERSEAAAFLAVLRSQWTPNAVLVVVAEPQLAELAVRVPLVEGKLTRDGRATAYVCEGGVCDLPTTDPEVFATQLR